MKSLNKIKHLSIQKTKQKLQKCATWNEKAEKWYRNDVESAIALY